MSKYRIVYDPHNVVYWTQKSFLWIFWSNVHYRSYDYNLCLAEERVKRYIERDRTRKLKKVVIREYN